MSSKSGRRGSDTRSLAALTLLCTFSAAIFGFGAGVLSLQSVYEETGREALIQFTRLAVYLALAILLVYKGRWKGVAAALVMVLAATAIEWVLLPVSYTWASLADPQGYAEEIGGLQRPTYIQWATFDAIGVGITAALAQGLRVIATANPANKDDW